MSVTEESAGATAIRPFTIKIPEAEIEALRVRICGHALAVQGAGR